MLELCSGWECEAAMSEDKWWLCLLETSGCVLRMRVCHGLLQSVIGVLFIEHILTLGMSYYWSSWYTSIQTFLLSSDFFFLLIWSVLFFFCNNTDEQITCVFSACFLNFWFTSTIINPVLAVGVTDIEQVQKSLGVKHRLPRLLGWNRLGERKTCIGVRKEWLRLK